MMVKGIAACPIDQLNIGIMILLAIILECRPGMQQHIGNTCYRNKIANHVYALRHGSKRQVVQIMSHPVYRRIS